MFPTAQMAHSFSAVTAKQIHESATTPAELALAYVYENLPGIMADFRLATLPFGSEPIEKIVLGVMLKGTQSQKTAMMKYLPMEAGLAFPELHKLFSGNVERWQTGISFIAAQIEKLAEFMGTKIPGDVNDVAEHILENYAGLTPVDVVRFFMLCRDGEFRSEFQSVSARGINADFLIDWLGQYCEKRELVWLQLVSKAKGNTAPVAGSGEPVARPDELIAREKKLAGLERDAQQRRMEIDGELVEVAHMEYWTKPVVMEAELEGGRKVKKTVQMPCDPGDPERAEREILPYKKDKPGAAYKRLHFFVQTFMTLDEPAEPFLKKLIAGWRNEFDQFDDPQIAFEDYARAESTKFVNSGKRIFSQIFPSEIIRRTLSQKTGHPAHMLNDQAQTVVKQFFAGWMEYLEASLAHPDAYPLKCDEYMIQRALIFAKQSGFPMSFERGLITPEPAAIVTE